eukprot:COSAG02_NODE_1528_length_12089_cov_21.637698_7_plen_89_part_00
MWPDRFWCGFAPALASLRHEAIPLVSLTCHSTECLLKSVVHSQLLPLYGNSLESSTETFCLQGPPHMVLAQLPSSPQLDRLANAMAMH